jgi:hypothetical protein
MAFWNAQNGKDPKRNFRFKIMIGGLAAGQPMIWWAKKVSKPNFTVTESKHSFLNHTYYWPGRVEWQTVTMTLVDPVDIDSSGNGTVKVLNQLFQEAGYLPLGSPNDDLKTQSRKKMNEKLISVVIEQLDAEGEPTETWTLHNPFIKKITYGELDYENDDLTQMEVEFRYDYAYCYVNNQQDTINFKPQEA